jgi:hypothetical protein
MIKRQELQITSAFFFWIAPIAKIGDVGSKTTCAGKKRDRETDMPRKSRLDSPGALRNRVIRGQKQHVFWAYQLQQ